uniref:CCHC-type domain-containing protein n=1 Tax=Serinus canaria TaxID=9135 RepID=A0A8C9MWQ4_SERCA
MWTKESPTTSRQPVMQSLAFGGANPDCQRVISAMPGRPSLAEMVEACSKVGTPQHVASIVRDELRREWEEQMKEQMKGHLEKQSEEKTLEEMLQQQKNEIMSEVHAAIKKSNPLGGQCYRCGAFGHIRKNCPQANIQVQALKLQNPVCERCGKGRHTARECYSQRDVEATNGSSEKAKG